MKNDVSGNDIFETENANDHEVEQIENEEDTTTDYEELQAETTVISTYDYTQYFENIQSGIAVNNAILLACVLLIGLVSGLRKS